jgi:hypothetical protein
MLHKATKTLNNYQALAINFKASVFFLKLLYSFLIKNNFGHDT